MDLLWPSLRKSDEAVLLTLEADKMAFVISERNRRPLLIVFYAFLDENING